MVDYNSHKVPELKKLLSDRSLPTTGVKADLIARLQEDDKTKSSASPATISAPPAGEDEIDWDEDDTKATTAPAAAAIAAGGKGPISTPIAVPNQVSSTDPSATSDLKVANPTPSTTEAKSTSETVTEAVKPEAPKQDFSANLEQTDAEKEALKRAKRAERFGVPGAVETDEEKKKAERAKKFGGEIEKADVKGLDSALPEKRERQPKRGREEQGGRNNGSKRQNNGGRNAGRGGGGGNNGARRNGGGGGGAGGARGGGGGGGGGSGRKITDDPVEREKAAARALKFKST